MFDQALRHMPFEMHRRLHLSALSRWMAVPAQAIATGSRKAAALASWPVFLAAGAGALAGDMLLNGPVATEAVERGSWAAMGLAGIAAMYAFAKFWRYAGGRESIATQAGSFAWAILGLGAAGVGLDMALGIHAAAFAVTDMAELPLISGSDKAHAMVMVSYAAMGLATAWMFRDELTAGRPSSLGLALAATSLVAAVTAGVFEPQAAAILAYASAGALTTAAVLRIGEAGGRRAFEDSSAGQKVSAWVRFAARAAESRFLVLKLMAFSVAVAAVSVAASAAVDPDSAEPAFFRDFGPVTFYSSGLMLLAGTMGLIAWARDRKAEGRGITRDLWGAWGLAFVVLAFDATPNFHGHIGGVIQDYTPFDHPFGFHRPSDFIVAVYGLAGLSISVMLWRQVFEHPVAILYFAGAVPFAMLTVAVDGFATHGWAPCVLEEGAELLAISFFAGGFARRYREARQPRRAVITELPVRAEALAA
jgi:hypothetical protein